MQRHQLETESDVAKTAFRNSAKHTVSVLHSVNEHCTWNLILKMKDMLESINGTYVRTTTFTTEEALPLLRVYKTRIDEVPPSSSSSSSHAAADQRRIEDATQDDVAAFYTEDGG